MSCISSLHPQQQQKNRHTGAHLIFTYRSLSLLYDGPFYQAIFFCICSSTVDTYLLHSVTLYFHNTMAYFSAFFGSGPAADCLWEISGEEWMRPSKISEVGVGGKVIMEVRYRSNIECATSTNEKKMIEALCTKRNK